MDAIKENKIIIVMVVSVILTFVIYFFVSSPSSKPFEDIKNKLSSKHVANINNDAKGVPNRGEIEAKKEQQRRLIDNKLVCLNVLHQYDASIEQHFSNAPFEERELFKTIMVQYTAELESFYRTFKNTPKLNPAWGLNIDFPQEPFNFITQKLEDEFTCRLGQKKFLIASELVTVLNDAIEKAKTIRTFKESPVCGIISLGFSSNIGEEDYTKSEMISKSDVYVKAVVADSRFQGRDVSDLYAVIPFEIKIAVDIEVWPIMLEMLSKPKAVKVSELRIDENTKVDNIFKHGSLSLSGSQSEIVRSRYGLRFVNLSSEVKCTPVNSNKSFALLEDKLFKDEYVRSFKDLIGFNPEQPLPPVGEDESDPNDPKRFKDMKRVRDHMETTFAKQFDDGPSFIILTIKGGVIDFLLEKEIKTVKKERENKEEPGQ